MKKGVSFLFVILFWATIIVAALFYPTYSPFGRKEKSINIFTWGDILESSLVAQFERESGIKVNLSFYSSNEELLVKMRATQGKGYDLIIPSDYAVPQLTQANLIQKIDLTKIPNLYKINHALLNRSFDPENRYTIPLEWEIYGFGIDKNYFKGRNPSWNDVFTAPKDPRFKLSMVNDPIVAVLFAGNHLFGPMTSLSKEQSDQVRALLKSQSPYVEAYVDSRPAYYLQTGNCPLVIGTTAYLIDQIKDCKGLTFFLPKEWTFITIENFAIPASSRKTESVYQFINFMIDDESSKVQHSTGLIPSNTESLKNLDLDNISREIIFTPEETLRSYPTCENLLPLQEIRDIWIDVKS